MLVLMKGKAKCRGTQQLPTLLAQQKFDRFQTLRKNSQQHATTGNSIQHGVQTDATCNIQQCWELLRPFARGLMVLFFVVVVVFACRLCTCSFKMTGKPNVCPEKCLCYKSIQFRLKLFIFDNLGGFSIFLVS